MRLDKIMEKKMTYKLFIAFTLCTLCSSMSYAVKYSNMGIVDDEIAKTIRSPKPPSVRQVIEDIENKPGYVNTGELDFSGNTISVRGATEILTYIADKLVKLHKLNLSYNRIYEEAAKDSRFTKELKRVLDLPGLEEVDLSGNGIATLSLLQQMSTELGDQVKKIKITDY